MKRKNREIDVELLRKLVRYEPNTGKLFWRERNAADVEYKTKVGTFNARYAGKEITKKTLGYIATSVFVNGIAVPLRGHRMAWAIHTGAWPVGTVDHINGIKDDNRFENLRVASNAENCRNKGLIRTNTSGHKGVSYQPHNGKWRAQIKANYKSYYLGMFPTVEEAVAAYEDAAKVMHKDFRNEKPT